LRYEKLVGKANIGKEIIENRAEIKVIVQGLIKSNLLCSISDTYW